MSHPARRGGNRWFRAALTSALLVPIVVVGHIFIFPWQRGGNAPCYPGGGWDVRCFYDIPDDSAQNLLTAEGYVLSRQPTFTFHADYIDWPAGERGSDLDTTFATMGDFLDDYVSNVSLEGALDLPFKHFLLKATGYFSFVLADAKDDTAPPIRKDFGLVVFDGGRVKVENTTIFRMVVPNPPDSFFFEDAIIPSPGAYRVEVTFFQKLNPGGTDGTERAGVELRTCQPDGLELPGGDLMVCPDGGKAKGTPPRLVYKYEDLLQSTIGDFDADNDVDLYDWSRFQSCFTGPGFEGNYDPGCEKFDLDLDQDVDLTDYVGSFGDFGGAMDCDRGG